MLIHVSFSLLLCVHRALPAIPVLSMFLTKLLTVDLPRLFVRPKKIVLDFLKGKAVGPVANDLKSEEIQEEKNKDFVGELSVTLLDARKLSYVFYGKTDPYVVLSLGDQVIRSKKNSQTTVIGPPGKPIWNQDFHLLVTKPRKEKLCIQVKDSLRFTDLTIGTGEVDLGTLQDTVPTDKIVVLEGGWGVLRKRSSGEILLRLTYKAYVEDEEDDTTGAGSVDADASDDELSDSDESNVPYEQRVKQYTDETERVIYGCSSCFDWPLKTRLSGVNGESVPSNSDKSSEASGGSTLLRFAVITSILVLTALNIGGSSFFNP
ncbi:hypothetical protein CRYUN_Cryun06bG0156600 [Craigia yunnanensis]